MQLGSGTQGAEHRRTVTILRGWVTLLLRGRFWPISEISMLGD